MSRSLAAAIGFGWVAFGYTAKSLAHVLALVILSRTLSKSEYGEVTLIFAAYNLLWSTVEVAIGYTVVRLPTARQSYLHTIYSISLFFGLSVSLLLSMASHLLGLYYGTSDISGMFILLSFGILIRSPSLVGEYLLYKQSRFGILARIDVTCYLVFAATLVAFVILGFAFWAMPAAQFAFMASKSALLHHHSPHSKALVIRPQTLRAIANYVSGFGGASLLSAATAEADKFLVGKALGLQFLGVYGRAIQIFMLPASVLGQAADYVLTSLLAKERTDLSVQARAVYGASNVMGLVMFPTSVVTWVLAPEIVGVFLGPGWEEVIPLLQVLCVSMYFRVSMKISEAVLRARGMVWRRLRTYTVYLLFLLPSLAAGAVLAGTQGVVWAVALSNVLFYVLMIETIRPVLDLSWVQILRSSVRGAVIAAAILGISLPAIQFLRAESDSVAIIAFWYVAGLSTMLPIAFFILGPRRVLGEPGYAIYSQLLLKIGGRRRL